MLRDEVSPANFVALNLSSVGQGVETGTVTEFPKVASRRKVMDI
jgi:hypothetical protein